MDNLAERLRVSASRVPEKAALVTAREQVTYAELDQRTDAVAAGFQQPGLSAGDRVALMLPNTPHFVEAFFGALRAGLVVVPINVGYTAAEVAHVLANSDTRAVVTAEAHRSVVVEAPESAASVSDVIVTGTAEAGEGTRSWRQFLSMGDKPEPVDIGGDDLALLPYTSGTTGQAKGAMLTHANLLANHRQMEQTRLAVHEHDVVL